MRKIALVLTVAVAGIVSVMVPAKANCFGLAFGVGCVGISDNRVHNPPMYARPAPVYRGRGEYDWPARTRNGFGGYRHAEHYEYAEEYRREGGRRRAQCDNGDQLTKLPSGREVCVDHITDPADLKQFGRRRSEVCKGQTGVRVQYNLGDGTVGNYDC